MVEFPNVPKPEHVPGELIKPWPYIFGTTTDKNPFTELAAEVHVNYPDIFYAEHGYPGGTGTWILQRAEDLRTVYFDTEHFSSVGFSPFAKILGENWSVLPTESDPPIHAKYRGLLAPLFTPMAMAKLEERIRQYAREYILGFKDKGGCEFVSEFAYEFPIKVVLELMGLPQDMTKQFLEWEHGLLHNHDLQVMAKSVASVNNYLAEQLDARRENPVDDLLSYVANGSIDGRPLTRDEAKGFAFNLYIGGLDTVSTNMSLHFAHLATNPDDQQYLRDNPDKINVAIEEMMRAYPAVTTFRTCVKQAEIKGVTFMPGDKVAMCTTMGGTDPNDFEHPEKVDFNRKGRHLGFGFGPHICIGLHLARREMRIAIEEFLQLVPEFKLREGHHLSYTLGMIQPVELPLEW